MRAFGAALLAAITAAKTMTQMDYDFMRYVSQFSKRYVSVAEFGSRQEIFAATDAHIRSVNENPESTHRSGHNKFSDWTWEEFDQLLGLKNVDMPYFESFTDDVVSGDDLPSTWDWRT